jgi:hypothetical protein
MNSQRGLSGTLRRTSRIARPNTTPSPKVSRQPTEAGKIFVFSAGMDSNAPPTAPSQ